MAKYFIINECKGDTFIHAISATTRAEALAAAITDYLMLTKSEQRDGRKVYAAEADGADESDFDWDLVTWTGYVNGNGFFDESIENAYRNRPSEADYVAVRYDDNWSYDIGQDYPSFVDYLRLVKAALECPWHEIAYIDEESGDCFGEFDINALL